MVATPQFQGSAYGELAGHRVLRVGFGAMQLERSVSGADRRAATAVLRRAVELGVNHIDTAQFYGAGTANALIKEALHPYSDDLQIVSKVGAERTGAGQLVASQRPDQLRAAVEQNLVSLGLEQLAVVNLRRMDAGPGIVAVGDQIVDIESQLAELVALREEGKIAAIGLSNVSPAVVDRARAAGIVCVQNAYNVLARADEAIVAVCAEHGIAWVPFFPLGSAFDRMPNVSDHPVVIETAHRLGFTSAQVGLAWLLDHSPNTLLIPGTKSVAHLEENVAVAGLELDDAARVALEGLYELGVRRR